MRFKKIATINAMTREIIPERWEAFHILSSEKEDSSKNWFDSRKILK